MFEITWPAFFLLLPLPGLMYLIKAKKTQVNQIPFPFRLPEREANVRFRFGNPGWQAGFFFLIWSLLILSASAPKWLGSPIVQPRLARNILLAVDLSGSMRLPDMTLNGRRATRLAVVKSVANQFIQTRGGDRLGLILFGSKAYLQTPLTFDHQTIQTLLTDATIGLAGQKTAIGDAIGLGVKRLQREADNNRILIVLTDGANNSGSMTPSNAAELAAKLHIKIYTIGIGSDELMVNPAAELDEKTLTAIAARTDGQYFRAKNQKELAKVYQTISALEPTQTNLARYRPFTNLYPWPLLLACLLWLSYVARTLRRRRGRACQR